VGIDAKEAQDISIAGEGVPDPETEQPAEGAEQQPAEDSQPSGDKDSALNEINDALRGIEDARDGSFEEYGRALDKLDRAVENYQNIQ